MPHAAVTVLKVVDIRPGLGDRDFCTRAGGWPGKFVMGRAAGAVASHPLLPVENLHVDFGGNDGIRHDLRWRGVPECAQFRAVVRNTCPMYLGQVFLS